MARRALPACLPGPWLPQAPRASAAPPAQWPRQPEGQGGQLSLIPQSGPRPRGENGFPGAEPRGGSPSFLCLQKPPREARQCPCTPGGCVWFWWRCTWPGAVSQELRVQLVLLVKDRFFFLEEWLPPCPHTPPPCSWVLQNPCHKLLRPKTSCLFFWVYERCERRVFLGSGVEWR